MAGHRDDQLLKELEDMEVVHAPQNEKYKIQGSRTLSILRMTSKNAKRGFQWNSHCARQKKKSMGDKGGDALSLKKKTFAVSELP